ncbi:hypothetical protein EP073_04810 [Geovibrio thiophilus]|uniref:ATPase AAA-type core domain-containing protein n=1 Tax=Geovibrio thiophilus TaxID=139438 RepID=A0A3R5UXA5_9BACT|nr:hypothetical protein [Geovibrio thiophilus]QAR32747.1 hypothetical protein EP073_04810 [Geovibrio thiophilus]
MEHINTRGSEWRKWDLHIHTPASINQNYGGENAWEKFISSLENLPENVKVLGITDYYFIDGYEKIMDYKLNQGRLNNILKIFPILEFRIDTFGSTNENTLSKINLHILFNIDESKINTEIDLIKKEFIEVIPISGNDKYSTKMLTKNNFIEICGNLQKGFANLIPPTKKVFETLNSTTWNDRIFTFLGYKEWSNLDKNKQLKDTKEWLYDKVDAFLTSNHINYESNKRWLNEFGDKPLIHSGDIHDFNFLDTLDKKTNNYCCMTWIKADHTFEGLKQIVNEPYERVFVGDMPPLLKNMEGRGGKYIDRISVKPIQSETSWFDFEIKLNPSLVAIIGNKGSGKSALADIIGLLGNSQRTDFSFLNNNKFLKLKNGHKFSAEIQWHNELTDSKTLDSKPNHENVPKVHLLSQNIIEKICENVDDTIFENEIHKVIFSHLSKEEREKCNSLAELITAKTNSIQKQIRQKFEEIKAINEQIIFYEKSLFTENINKLNNLKDDKKIEIIDHLKLKPAQVKKPIEQEQSPEMKKILDELDTVNIKGEKLKKQIDEMINEQTNINKKLTAIKNINNTIDILKEHIQIELSKLGEYFQLLGLRNSDIVKFTTKKGDLDKLKNDLTLRKSEISKDLDESLAGSVKNKINILKVQYTKLKAKLNENEQNYQNYLSLKTDWKNKFRDLYGSKSEPTENSYNFYRIELKKLDNYRLNIPELKKRRISKSQEIHQLKVFLKNELAKLFQPVALFLETNTIVPKKDFKMEFSTEVENRDFKKNFLEFIDRGAVGSFYGINESDTVLTELISNTDFNQADSTVKFLEEVCNRLYFDHRNQKKEMRLQSQLRSERKESDVLNYIYSMNYLTARYKLKWDGKELSELSPGERGQMLMIFYLIIDKSDIPIIIDQPEDNLDNQSVYRVLMPCIKKARDTRQVIIVTHNPNLAIACDAEQIVVSNINKQDNNKVSYNTGSIESKIINKHSLDILEGTREAFTKRGAKYL